jgi:hypothetical protein
MAQPGEARRRYMMLDYGQYDSGYGRDTTQVYADWLTGLLASGSSASDSAINRMLAFGSTLRSLRNRGWLNRGGAGQNSAHKQFAMAFGHVFASVSGVFQQMLDIEAACTHQTFFPQLSDIGKGAHFPDSNHEVFLRPYDTPDVNRSSWFLGGVALTAAAADATYDSEVDTDYEFTASIAMFAEINNIMQLREGLGGLDGSAILQTYFPAALAYYDRLRAITGTGVYILNPYSTREAAYYDARRASASVSRVITTPDNASEVSGVTAGASKITVNYDAMGHDGGASITARDTYYSMDGIQFATMASHASGNVDITGLVPGWRYYVQRRRQNSAGWGPRSYNAPHSNQGITSKASGSTTAGSRTVTLTISTGSPTARVGDLISGTGISPGTYITAFGTGTGVAGNTGTYTISMPAHETASAQQYRMAPMRGMATPTGTPSGTVAWTTQPVIHRRKFAPYNGTLFDVAASDGSDVANEQFFYCGMGIMSGNVLAPTFQWKLDGVAIPGAEAQGQAWKRTSAATGALTCTITSNGVSATTAAIALPALSYPSRALVTFDGTNDNLLRSTALVGAVDGPSITIVKLLKWSAGSDGVLKCLTRAGIDSVPSSNEYNIQLDRSATNKIVLTLRKSLATVFSRTSTSDFKVADGEALLMISVNAVTGVSHFYLGNTAMTMGAASGTPGNIGLGDITHYAINATVTGTARAPVEQRFEFMHPGFIDFSVSGNRDKFANAVLAGNGQISDFGVPAQIMLGGAAADWNAGTNWGSGGNFTMTGAVA